VEVVRVKNEPPPRPELLVIRMTKNLFALAAACAITCGATTPSIAADNALGGVGSMLGTGTALLIDIPEGIALRSLWYSPLKATKALAGHFGDENGLQQNVVGALIGIPFGVVWGIPTGAIQGGRHALDVGWEKPFSTESYIVTEEK
jgi:hypothetical protein